ncbi:hypothetical protein HOB87_07485 [Candidatus Woesearchaeota archaeon]|jgi:hypothetical protein|nr:hypothetical protein [Campylobacteraceae bacterium]MBT4731795.1 hypothetical protein [Candidatus Woesearchaeota archaeon]
MNEDIKKPDLSHIQTSGTLLKNCLEKWFGRIYIQEKAEVPENDITNLSNNNNNFSFFEIKKTNPPIYTSINSLSDLSECKKTVQDSYKKLIDEYGDLFEEVGDELNENTIESLEIISKLLDNRKKKIESSFNKFKPDDSWDIAKIQDEFSHVLVNILKDILEVTSISISNGLKQSSVYEKIIEILNSFYSYLGIYTKEYKVNEMYTDDDLVSINPTVSQDGEIKDKNYQNKIKSVESLAYLFEDNIVVLEANIVVWRIS